MNKPPKATAERLQQAFGVTLKSLRLRVGIPQETLALETETGRSYMSGLERGLHNPTLHTIYRMLPALEVSFIEFAQELEKNLHARRS